MQIINGEPHWTADEIAENFNEEHGTHITGADVNNIAKKHGILEDPSCGCWVYENE